MGGCLKRGGAGTVCQFKGGGGAWQERGGLFSRGVDTSMHTMTD